MGYGRKGVGGIEGVRGGDGRVGVFFSFVRLFVFFGCIGVWEGVE